MTDVLIVGGGIMGTACGLELAKRGRSVTILERAIAGAEASSAAAGMLAAQSESEEHADQLTTLVHAREGYAAFCADLEARAGFQVGYRKSGVVHAAFSETEAEGLAKIARDHVRRGHVAEVLDAAAARALEPGLSDRQQGGVFYPDDAQVEPPRLLRALTIACERAGVRILSGTTVEGLAVTNSKCRGVRVSGRTMEAGATILAAGSWSSLVPGQPSDAEPVTPARGQLIELDERSPRVRHIVKGRGAYVVPRGDGRVVCGSTLEFVGFVRDVTAGGLRDILARATEVVPVLESARFERAWCNFRPHANKMAVGASSVPGLFFATGHHRNGILLAPWTAGHVADAIG
jgi:glycine oxidase